MSLSGRARATCFLCGPNEELVFLRSEAFFAMLGIGPLVEGYSLIATTFHVPSMMDLDEVQAEELVGFTRDVQQLLATRFGPAVLTEHGRVAACVRAATDVHEPHCLHAHRLVFPGVDAVDLRVVAPTACEFSGFMAARDHLTWPGQYLYSESPTGRCQLAPAPRRLPRQLLRSVVAGQIGVEGLADWRAHPRLDVVAAARRRLARAA